jgi:hypothetical protein
MPKLDVPVSVMMMSSFWSHWPSRGHSQAWVMVGSEDWANVELPELLCDLCQNTVHADTWVLGVAYLDMVAVEVDGVHLRHADREACCVEVGLDGSNAEDEISRLDAVFDASIRAVAGVYTTVVW